MPTRPARAILLLGLVVLCWGAAAGILWLHLVTGPRQQSINVRWVPEASELARRAAERALKLGTGDASASGTWVYRLQDHSTDAIRSIVVHPLVADTGHIDRDAFRILIDAPGIPAVIRVVLERDLAPPLAVAAFLLGSIAFWPVRGDAARLVAALAAVRGLELATALTMLGVGFWLFHDNGQGVDENVHYDQIVRFARGDFSLHPALTMLPGFHLLVAGATRALGGANEFSVRLVVFLLSLATIATFHALAVAVQPAHAGQRTLQFTLLPMLFPQFFLIYTDVASLLFVLLLVLATVRGHLVTAGAMGVLACLARQNNVIWVAFAMVWSCVREAGWTWRVPAAVLIRHWAFVGTGAAFLVFVVMNGGEVALGEDADAHPLGALYFTNLFFLLFLCAFLFLPLWWGYRREALVRLRSGWPWLVVAGLFPIFWFGFVNDHPYNNDRPSYFLPNALLMYFSSGAAQKALFFAPVAVSALLLCVVRLQKFWWLLLPFTVVFLLPEWLVVPRYYLIPLSLFLLSREPGTPAGERLQTALFAVVSVVLFLVVERGLAWV